MDVLQKCFAVVSLLLVHAEIGLACNGYKLVTESIKTCDDQSVITTKNYNISLDENCMLVTTGCLVITKPFKIAEGEYRVKKSPLPEVVGKLDICKVAVPTNKKYGFLADMGLKCPMDAKTICGKGATTKSLAKFKNQMPMLAGKMGIMVTLQHDSGKTCLDIIAEIKQ